MLKKLLINNVSEGSRAMKLIRLGIVFSVYFLPCSQLNAAYDPKGFDTHDSPLITAIIRDDIEEVKKEVDKGANVNFINRVTWTPLMAAAAGTNTQIARLLIARGAQINYLGNLNRGPLIVAVCGNNSPMAELLIISGADVNQIYPGSAPLVEAIGHKNLYLIDLLLTNGAKADLVIPSVFAPGGSYTPLQIADLCNDPDIIKTIEKHLTDWQRLKWKANRLFWGKIFSRL